MTEHPSPRRELSQASAAFALLNFSTNDRVFSPQSQPCFSPIPRRGSRFETPTCDFCLGQSIQQKNSQLYHVKIIKEHLAYGVHPQIHTATIFGTFTDLLCAKNAAYTALVMQSDTIKSHEIQKDFPELDKWPYEKDVFVRVVTHECETFVVSIETEPNCNDLVANTHGEICNVLYYAMQQIIRYSEDRNGLKRETKIEGTFNTRSAARKCAEDALLKNSQKVQFDYYEVFDQQKHSSFGKDVVIHAVADNGDDYILSLVKVKRESKACRAC